jgi:hypothetical protein
MPIGIAASCGELLWSYGSWAGTCSGTEEIVTLDLADPIAVLLAAADALGKAGIEVAAYGGLALAAYGAPR